MDVHSQQTMTQQTRLPMNPNINEAICLEVVGILKRCFMQQASVKTTLYKGEVLNCLYFFLNKPSFIYFFCAVGLFSAICVNPHLCTLVLDVLLDHFGQFYEQEEDVLPPLVFERTISIRNSIVSLEVLSVYNFRFNFVASPFLSENLNSHLVSPFFLKIEILI